MEEVRYFETLSARFLAAVSHGSGTNPAAVRGFRRRYSKASGEVRMVLGSIIFSAG